MLPDPNLREIKKLLTEALELVELAEAPSLLDLFATGEILTTAQAGLLRQLSAEQIRRRCVHTHDVGQPIGILIAGVWLVSKKRLLEDIEEYEGLHGRLAAESRARKLVPMWASPPDITEID